MSGVFFGGGGGGGGGGEHAHNPKFGGRFFCEKTCIRHFARFKFLRLLLAFILKYYPILHVMKK